MLIFMPTKRLFLYSKILSHWYHFEAQHVGNNISKKIKIVSTEFLAIVICIYKRKFLVFCFSPNTIRCTKLPPQSHPALRKYSSTKSYSMCDLKARPVELSAATMYDTIYNFVWLPWQPFKSRTLISWGLFVTTTRRNIELLMQNETSPVINAILYANIFYENWLLIVMQQIQYAVWIWSHDFLFMCTL